MKTNLTDVAVRALKAPPKGQLTVWDKTSPLGVRVSQGGSKTFILMIGSGKRRTLGRFGILTLSKARDEARRIVAEKTLGISRPIVKTGKLFDAAVPAFIEEHYEGKKPRTKHEANRLLTTRFPGLNKKLLSEITDDDISADLKKLAATPSEQLHAFRTLRVFFKWCMRPPHRYIKHSPLEGFPAPGKDKKGKRILSDDELVKIWDACEGPFGDMVRLLILWGCRNGEIGRLMPEWRERQVITIPGEFTKNGRAHAIPILPMARLILERRRTNARYYFPGRLIDDHFKDGSWGKFKNELEKRSGVTGWQLRDLRRTFRSTLARLKVPREIAEIMLNHVTGGGKGELDEIYDRYHYLPEKTDALKKLEAHLKRLFAAQR
ncbi:site-specific integrase [Bradyrhizobium sp. ORS 285]|uniref:site-specific integrase n=1 Tax=Bradyrhizobium sp. ORS 285 TaxID=115808 RepID=UPI000A038C15|nr:site-specific integrase [Bradyrhizobium sp. ORS 285]